MLRDAGGAGGGRCAADGRRIGVAVAGECGSEAQARCRAPLPQPGAGQPFLGLLSALLDEHKRVEARLEALAAENSRLRASAWDPGVAQEICGDTVAAKVESARFAASSGASAFSGHFAPEPKSSPQAAREEEEAECLVRGAGADLTDSEYPVRAHGMTSSEAQDCTLDAIPRYISDTSLQSRMRSERHVRALSSKMMVNRVQKLHKWWVRVDRQGAGLLTQRQLQDIYARVNPAAKHLPERTLDRLLEYLHDPDIVGFVLDEEALGEVARRANEQHSLGGSAVWSRSHALSLDDVPDAPERIMNFQAFVVLLVWDGLQELLPLDVHMVATKLRDALTRHSAEMLVAHYANIKVVDQEGAHTPPRCVFVLDSVSGLMIVLNGITIGIASDYSSTTLDRLELFFAFYFVFELACKLYLTGCRRYFTGPDMKWNLFDCLVVFLSVIDAAAYIYEQASKHSELDSPSLGPVTLIRLARLARLTRLMRLLRVLRLRMFKELTLIAKGVVAGMRMLVWAIAMLFFVVYFGAVLMRQTVGPDRVAIGDVYGTVLFSDLMWSMFMIFRILMQDGTLPDGTPISGRMYELYGAGFMIPYMFSLLFVVFGVFNLMTALFVENVLEAAKQKKQLTIAQERVRVAQKLRELVLKLTGQRIEEDPGILRKSLTYWCKLNPVCVDSTLVSDDVGEGLNRLPPPRQDFEMEGNITRQMFLDAIGDPAVEKLLNDLEVQMSDRTELFEVLDADGSGTLDISELISGLMKLRSGGTDKSDGVATVLGVRAIMRRVRDIEAALSCGAGGAGGDALAMFSSAASLGATGEAMPSPKASLKFSVESPAVPFSGAAFGRGGEAPLAGGEARAAPSTPGRGKAAAAPAPSGTCGEAPEAAGLAVSGQLPTLRWT